MRKQRQSRNLAVLTKKRRSLRKSLVKIYPILRGSVVTLGVKCGNPNCKCAKGKTHPSVYFSISKKGRTKIVYLGKGVQAQAEQWVANYAKQKEIVDRLTEVNLEILLSQRRARKHSK